MIYAGCVVGGVLLGWILFRTKVACLLGYHGASVHEINGDRKGNRCAECGRFRAR